MAFSYISNNYGPSKATENTASASLNPQYTALLQRYHVADSDSKNACYAIDLGNVLQVVMLQASGDRLNGIVIKHYTQHTGAKLDPKAVDDYLKDYFKPVIDAGCANVLPSINRTNYIESEVSIYSLNHPENVRALEKVGLVQPPIPEQISAGEFGSALMAGGYIPRTK